MKTRTLKRKEAEPTDKEIAEAVEKYQAEALADIELSIEIAKEAFGSTPTEEQVFWVRDNIVDFEDKFVVEEARDNLSKAIGDAKRLFGTPSFRAVCEIYERVYSWDGEDEDEDE